MLGPQILKARLGLGGGDRNAAEHPLVAGENRGGNTDDSGLVLAPVKGHAPATDLIQLGDELLGAVERRLGEAMKRTAAPSPSPAPRAAAKRASPCRRRCNRRARPSPAWLNISTGRRRCAYPHRAPTRRPAGRGGWSGLSCQRGDPAGPVQQVRANSAATRHGPSAGGAARRRRSGGQDQRSACPDWSGSEAGGGSVALG